MENNDYFKINRSGRSGSITYQRGNNNIEIYWEMSGSPKYDILLSPINLKEWGEPKGLSIPLKEQLQILQKLRAWSHKQNMKTDIDLPSNLSFENQPLPARA